MKAAKKSPSLVLLAPILLAACAAPQVHVEDATEFKSNPVLGQNFESHGNPPGVTGEDERALARKGYVNIGTISAWHQGRDNRAKTKTLLERNVLSKAAQSAGDLVRVDRDAVPGAIRADTGKTRKVCLKSKETAGGPALSTEIVNTTISDRNSAFYGLPTSSIKYSLGTTPSTVICEEWGTAKVWANVEGLITEGTVWRYDPRLSASVGAARRREVETTITADVEGLVSKMVLATVEGWRRHPALSAKVVLTHRDDDKATVYVFRESSIWGSALKRMVYCDDVELARLPNGRYFRVRLESGTHVFRTESVDFPAVFVGARPGGVYFVQMSIYEGGFAGLLFLPPKTYPAAILNLKALGAGEVVDRTRVAAEGATPDKPSLKDLF